ncbi:MAG: ECF transporter S component [Clostridia bacterium]|nr:ECF transporter S component [Clostridia bacterium]
MMKTKTKSSLLYMAKVGVLSAMATVLMLFEFPLPIAPSFYELDFSEVAVLIGSFALGPLAGVIIEFIKILINLLINGTDTFFVGELANFLMGCAFVLPAALVYCRKKTLKRAIVGMAVGTLSLVLVGAFCNYFLMIPAYVHLAGYPMDAIIGMGAAVNPAIKDLLTLIIIAVIPFNLIKGVLCSLLTGLLYKRVSHLLNK